MENARTEPQQGILVLPRAIAFVLCKAIAREAYLKIDHHPIAAYFGQNGCCRDRQDPAIAMGYARLGKPYLR